MSTLVPCTVPQIRGVSCPHCLESANLPEFLPSVLISLVFQYARSFEASSSVWGVLSPDPIWGRVHKLLAVSEKHVYFSHGQHIAVYGISSKILEKDIWTGAMPVEVVSPLELDLDEKPWSFLAVGYKERSYPQCEMPSETALQWNTDTQEIRLLCVSVQPLKIKLYGSHIGPILWDSLEACELLNESFGNELDPFSEGRGTLRWDKKVLTKDCHAMVKNNDTLWVQEFCGKITCWH
jgi:hypothetical protein